jgi:hypothetical protein
VVGDLTCTLQRRWPVLRMKSKGFVFAQGFGDTEAQAGGFVGKCEFPEFA